MSFWYNLLTGAGLFYIFNNYIIININSFEYKILNNKIAWELLKWYAVNKQRTVTYVKNMKNKICGNNLQKNIVFYKNGKRENILSVDEYNEDIYSDLEKFDMILYRCPSTDSNDKYDLLRLPCDKESLKDLQNKEYSCYKGKIHSPMLSFNDNSEKNYDMDLYYDNYYVVGNIIFDYHFIKLIMREKYKIENLGTNYTISYFDEDMCENTLTVNNSLKIEETKIIKINNEIQSNSEIVDTDIGKTESTGWFW